MICSYCGKPSNNFEPLVGYMIPPGLGVEWHQSCIDEWEDTQAWIWEEGRAGANAEYAR